MISPVWDTSCKDWERRIVAGESLIPFKPLFPEEAASALEVFKSFRVVDVQGGPTVGEIAKPWILDFASTFFGAYDPEAGKRLIQTYYLKVSKKNWKSGIAAFLMGTLLIRNWRESGEFGIIAPTTEVANNAFGPLAHAIRKDEELSDLLHIQDHIKTITNRETKATLQVVAAESDTVSGKKFAVTLVEELWQFGKRHNADSMLQEATGGMASRPEGAVIYITTESDGPPSGVYRAKNIYARKVRDGEICDPSFLPVLYEWPQHMIDSKECLDLKNAWMTNPNLGASVSADWLSSKFREAQEESEIAFTTFCAKHLNLEIGLALRSDRWAGAEFWEACGSSLILPELLERSEVVVFGIDGGGLDDLLGLCAIGRDRETRKWLAWHHAWAYKIVLERRKDIASRLIDFKNAGLLTIVEQPGQDVDDVADIICQVRDRGLLPEKNAVGVDQAGIGDIVDELTSESRGITAEQIIGIAQGWRLNGAIKTTERKLAGGEIVHGGNALMNWCVSNAKVVLVGNAITVTKAASGTAKIDPLMATFDAVTLMSLSPEAQGAKHQFMIL